MEEDLLLADRPLVQLLLPHLPLLNLPQLLPAPQPLIAAHQADLPPLQLPLPLNLLLHPQAHPSPVHHHQPNQLHHHQLSLRHLLLVPKITPLFVKKGVCV